MKNVEWIFEVLYDIEKFAELNSLDSMAKSLRDIREAECSHIDEVEELVRAPKLRLVSRRSAGLPSTFGTD